MSVGGVGSADVATAVATAQATASADPAAAPTPPAPDPAVAAQVADGFTASNPALALPDLGSIQPPTNAAYQDFVAAKADLRQARHEPVGTAGRRADIRQARHEVRQAKAELNAQTSGAGSALLQDTFNGPATATATAKATAGLRPDPSGNGVDTSGLKTGAPATFGANKGNGLALGHQLPEISQLAPAGNDGSYRNADMNCAPTALAMIARTHPGATLDGVPVGQLTDAQLISRIGDHAQTDAQGTSPNGLIAAAEDLGLQTSAHEGGFDPDYVDNILAQGGSVVANGAYYINNELAGHFVTVAGKNADGTYSVNDPLQGRVSWTAQQLDAFLRSNPHNGGVSIGIL